MCPILVINAVIIKLKNFNYIFLREINCLFTFSGNTYRSTLSLTNHIANVHEKVPCSICGEMISKKRETRHIQQKHTANCDKKFKCKYCGKGFVGSSYLRDHVNTHTG